MRYSNTFGTNKSVYNVVLVESNSFSRLIGYDARWYNIPRYF